MHLKSLEFEREITDKTLTVFIILVYRPHLVPTGHCWEGRQSPGAEVEVAVDGAGGGPVRGAEDRVQVLHRRGDDVSHGEGVEPDCIVKLSHWNTLLATYYILY